MVSETSTSQVMKGTKRSFAQRYWLSATTLLGEEEICYQRNLTNVFGFYALQVGLEEAALLTNSRISQCYVASDRPNYPGQHQLCCRDEALPFNESSVDALLLPHRLEFSTNPHQTLREAARVMMPDGHLLLSGFNPWSLLGLTRLLLRRRRYPYYGNWLSLARVKDWCTLLGFEVLTIERCGNSTPLPRFAWQQSLLNAVPALACLRPVYVLVARKRVLAVTPLKLQWKRTRFMRGVTLNSPKKNKQAKHDG